MEEATEATPEAKGAVDRVILRPKQVVQAGYATSEVSLWRAVRAGRFPKPVQLGPNAVGYLKADLERWLAERAAERSPA